MTSCYWLKAVRTVLGAVCLVGLVSACNTIEGAGEDIEQAGDEIEEATSN